MASAAPVSCPRCEAELAAPFNYCPECGEDLRKRRRRSTRASSSAREPAGTGRVVAGRYRLVERLGEGGMGAVWRAEHVRMGKVLALKLLRPDVATPRLRARFQDEARLVSQLSHPNTIQVFDAGELPDGSLYIAMEYLPGQDLARTLREHGPLPEAQVLAIGSQVLASLAEAHELGIVHRDIKPANVMRVEGRGGAWRVKVLDFGIAKLTEREVSHHLTGTTDLVGTPAYMSPEQARGEQLDARSDLYSVGALLFELATGRHVYRGPTAMSVVAQHLDERRPPPRPSEVAPELRFSHGFEALLQRALTKRLGERFQGADAMRAAVDSLRRQLGMPLREAAPDPESRGADVAQREDFARYERAMRRRRALAPVLALAALGGLGLGSWHVSKQLEADARRVRAAEHEPNDTPARANRIALGQPVRGHVAAGPAAEGGDRDVYLLEGAGGPLTVELSGLPDLNLLLEVAELERGPDGRERLRRLVLLDDAPVGGAERVDGLRTGTSALYLRVEERAHPLETERPSRESRRVGYTLLVRPSDAVEGVEVEPNDTPESATRVEVGRAGRGRTGAFVGYPLDARLGAPSAADHFVAGLPALAPQEVFAVVVPPPVGALWLEDASVPASVPESALDVADAGAQWLGPVRAELRPQVLALRPGPFGHVLRVLPGTPGRAPGAEYRVAFFHAGEGGREAVEALARALEAEGRYTERAALLQRVEAVLPRPGVAAVDAVDGGLPDGGVLAVEAADAGVLAPAMLVVGAADAGVLAPAVVTVDAGQGAAQQLATGADAGSAALQATVAERTAGEGSGPAHSPAAPGDGGVMEQATASEGAP